MKYFVRLDASGLPSGWGIRPAHLPEGTVEVDAAVYVLLPGVWFDGTAWQARPTVAAHALTAEGVAIAGLPASATVTVEDGETGQVLATTGPAPDGSLDVALPDPGPYEITVTAPAPWLPWTLRVVR
jgi:hypothetical protein